MATFTGPVLLLILFGVLVGPVSAQGDGFDLKGIRLSATEAEIKNRFPSAACAPIKEPLGDRLCTVPHESYGGADATLQFALSEDKAASLRALFKSQDFVSVTTAMRKRFGTPTEEHRETVTNRMGAKFENTSLVWMRGDEVLLASRFSGSIDKSSVLIFSRSGYKSFEQRSDKAAKKRAGDL